MTAHAVSLPRRQEADTYRSRTTRTVCNEQGKTGPDVNWINVNTGETGAGVMAPEKGILNAPALLVEPEGGTAITAVWGMYENSKGENCFLLPGIDVSQLAGEPDEPEVPGD